jgi:hypothetical protein
MGPYLEKPVGTAFRLVPEWRSELAMKTTPRQIAIHIAIIVVLLVVESAVSIWQGTGPVVLSP